MLSTLLLRLWPALIPIALYLLWRVIWLKRRNTRNGEPGERASWISGAWGWVAIASLLMLIASFLMLGLSAHRRDGVYVPPHVEGGRLIDGDIE